MIVELREARPGDAEAVHRRLRAREAARIAGPAQIVAAMERSLFVLVGTIDDAPAVMCGAELASLLDDRAYLWLLGTTLIDRHPSVFLRHSRRALAVFAARFTSLYGQVECDFTASERWLRWLGVEFIADAGQTKVFRWNQQA